MNRREFQRRQKLAEARWELRKPMRPYTVYRQGKPSYVKRRRPSQPLSDLLQGIALLTTAAGLLVILLVA